MTTLNQALQQGTQHLIQNNCQDSPRLDTELLLSHTLNQPRSYLYTWPEKPLTDQQQQHFQHLLQQRAQGTPIAYLIGEKEFWGLPLKVTPDTLIPRPDTELLVETALTLAAEHSHLKILDLGTGSGAIALALSHQLKTATLLATDKSPKALKIAQLNAQHLNLNIQFKLGHWFQALQTEPTPQFDLICSNPPYIDPQDPHLQRGDLRYEPLTALTAEQQGLSDLAEIIQQAPQYLTPRNGLGWLLVEHGHTQHLHIQQHFQQAGFQQIHTRKDLNNQPRITLGKIP